MATINPITLNIVLDGDSTSQVNVDYSFTFDELDRLANVQYRETVQLFGADSGLNGADDVISGGVLRDVFVNPNGDVTVSRSLSRNLSNRALNEDRGRDEIYARVTLDPVPAQLNSVSRDSNQVSHNF